MTGRELRRRLAPWIGYDVADSVVDLLDEYQDEFFSDLKRRLVIEAVVEILEGSSLDEFTWIRDDD